MVLEDNQKIGIGLICLGGLFISLGIVLFLDASLIAIGNMLFLAGLAFSIGLRRTIGLFSRYVEIGIDYSTARAGDTPALSERG